MSIWSFNISKNIIRLILKSIISFTLIYASYKSLMLKKEDALLDYFIDNNIFKSLFLYIINILILMIATAYFFIENNIFRNLLVGLFICFIIYHILYLF